MCPAVHDVACVEMIEPADERGEPAKPGESADRDGTTPADGEPPIDGGEHFQDGDAAVQQPERMDPIEPAIEENGLSEEGAPARPDDRSIGPDDQ